MSDRVRIGAVSYLNARPLVHGLERGLGAGRARLSYAPPAELADEMLAGRLELALLPVIELARMTDLELVPGLGIVTRGASRSVLLVSRRPVAEVRSVALDPESRTSNALCRLLFAELWRSAPTFALGPVSLERALGSADAAVRIGDKALFEPLPEGSHVYDLGTVWTEATGLPFVFAAWAARPGVVDPELYRMLHESRRRGSRALRQIAEAYEWQGRRAPGLALDYLNDHILYRLGAAELDGLRLFFRAARRAGIIDVEPQIRLALERWTSCHETAAARGLIAEPARGGGS